MTKLNRYVGRQVFLAIMMVLLLVVGLDIIAALLDQLGELSGRYGFLQALVYVCLTIPGRVHEYTPLAALVGSLIAMGALSSGSELTVMRASGVSVVRLVWLASRPVFLLIVFSISISEFVSPYTDQWAQSYRAFLKWGEDRSLASREGLWHREGNEFMHISVVQPGGVLYGVSSFELDTNDKLVEATFAARATYQSTGWLMEDVKKTRFHPDRTSSQTLTTYRWGTQLTPALLGYLALSAEDLSMSGLLDYAKYLDQQELDSGEYRLAYWQKALHPAAIFSLVLIAMSFIFGPLRESTTGYRVFVGIVVGISFQFAQNLLGPSSLIYGYSPLFAVAAPIAFCAFAGVLLLLRTR